MDGPVPTSQRHGRGIVKGLFNRQARTVEAMATGEQPSEPVLGLRPAPFRTGGAKAAARRGANGLEVRERLSGAPTPASSRTGRRG
jgi:hypothetical protein